MKKVILVFILQLAVALAHSQNLVSSSSRVEIPFTMDRNLIMIKAKINADKEYDFIFDTGTGGFVLRDSLVKLNKLKQKGFITLASPQDNSTVQKPNYITPSIDFGAFSLKKQQTMAINGENIFSPTAMGIIGLSAFNGYLVTIDYKNSKLIVEKGKILANDKNAITLKPLMILETDIMLNGKAMAAHFDCGSPSYMAIPMDWKADLNLQAEPTLAGRGRTPNGEFEVYRAKMLGKVEIGNQVIENPDITLLTGGFRAINLGFEFFKRNLITIDLANRKLRIVPQG